MLVDGISLVEGSVISNSHVETGTAFPTTNTDPGRMFFLTQAVGSNQPGFYVYNGVNWITGDITSIIASTGMTGGGSSGDITLGVDTSVIATKAFANSTYQPVSGDLTAIATSLGAGTGFLKKNGTVSWVLDTNTYITGNQNITITGDVSGSGSTAIAVTLVNSGVTPGTYQSVTVDAKGRVTAGTRPTTLAGYGITDALPSSYQYSLTLGDGTTQQITYQTNQRLDFIAGSNVSLQFNDTTNAITISTTGTFSGTADAAQHLATARSIAITGDGTWSVNFDGSANTTAALTLASTGVTPSTYTKVTVDAKGRVTAGTTLTSNDVQVALGYVPVNPSSLGVSNGVATLDSSGKLTSSQIPASLVGAPIYQTTWDANANSPVLTSGVGVKGNYYKVSTAGTTSIDGIAQWYPGDTIIFDGTTWDKIDGIASEVFSVAGRTGTVVLTTSDVAEGSNLYFTAARAQAAVTVTFSSITSKPTTIVGYGITDALNKTGDSATGKIHFTATDSASTALGNVSGTVNIDCSLACTYSFTPTATTTLNFTNPPAAGMSQAILLKITNGGSQTLNFPAGTKNLSSIGTLTTSGVDWLGVAYDTALSAWVVFVLGKAVA